jgi:hypothetical protein
MLKYVSLLPLAILAVTPLAHAQADQESPQEHAYQGRMDRQIRSWIHEGNHQATPDERAAIEKHWARTARLWRIRKLAAAAHDMASVARADRLLARADHVIELQLRRFREHAPVFTEAPPDEVATVAPPPPRTEARPPQPSPHHVWLPGYWAWRGGRHAWIGGHWEEPPQTGMSWMPPRWENRAGKWDFHEGHWNAAAAAPNVVYEPPTAPDVVVEHAPPPPRIDVRPPQPKGAVWIPGYWQWTGHRHVWVSGRWSAPKTGMRWQPDHWERQGNRYHLVRGHWAR